jgi:hypothetical protein
MWEMLSTSRRKPRASSVCDPLNPAQFTSRLENQIHGADTTTAKSDQNPMKTR